MNNAPLISVLMPIFNAQKDLCAAIESVLHQSFGNFEFLIVDDGSTDQSVEIVRSYDDPRIRLLVQPNNLGLVAALNRGISEARGEYIAKSTIRYLRSGLGSDGCARQSIWSALCTTTAR